MANEKRLIDLDEAMKAINDEIWWTSSEKAYFRSFLLRQKRVDAEEVIHGHWVSDEGDVLFHCSECETQISTSWDYDDLLWNYCPSCGAFMG